MPYPKRILAASIVAGLYLAWGVDARAAAVGQATQTAGATAASASQPTKAKKPAVQPSAKQLEGITVDGTYQSSLSHALELKRTDTRVVDAVSSEDIGKFPAENIAEAIQQIPGVQMQEINGRGATISIRGLGPEYAATTINGQQIKSADFTDGFRFDIIQPEIAKSIEVIKSPTASMDAGGLSGTINIQTVKPLDYSKPKLIVSAKAQRSDYRGGAPTPKAVATYIDQFFDHTLGVYLNVGDQKLKDRADYFWIDRWASATDADGNPIIMPTRPRFRRIDRDTRRWMFNGGLQWKPSDSFEAGLNALYSRDRTDNHVYQQVFLLNHGTESILDTANGAATRVQAQNFVLENNYQFEKHDWANSLLTGYLNWKLGQWDLRASTDYTQGKTKESEAAAILGIHIPNAILDVDRSGAFYVDQNLADAAAYSPGALTRDNYPDGAIRNVTNTLKSAQMDAERWLDSGVFSSFKLGAKYSDESLNRKIWRRDEEALTDAQQAAIPYPLLAEADAPVTDFMNGSAAVQNAWASPYLPAYAAAVAASGFEIPGLFVPSSSYQVKRKIAAVYAMANLDTQLGTLPVRGNFGVRYEKTRRTVDAYVAGPSLIDQDGDPGTVIGTTQSHYDYGNVLPSLNLVVEWRPDLQSHFSLAKVLVRPILDSNTQISTTEDSASNSYGTTTYSIDIGQPTMKPLTARQADLSLEWYYTQASALTADVFYKAIKNGSYEYNVCPASYDGTALSQRSGDCVDSAGNLYDITQTKNDPSTAKLKGFELDWTQSLDTVLPVPGFGLNANYTRVIPEYQTAGYQVRNLSKRTWNATVFYEHAGFSARVILNHRSQYYQGVQDSFFAHDGHEVRARSQLNLMFGYSPNDALSFSLGVLNANNTREQAYKNNSLIWQESSYVGRSLFAGVEWKIL